VSLGEVHGLVSGRAGSGLGAIVGASPLASAASSDVGWLCTWTRVERARAMKRPEGIDRGRWIGGGASSTLAGAR
jgi:hypothetical protein